MVKLEKCPCGYSFNRCPQLSASRSYSPKIPNNQGKVSICFHPVGGQRPESGQSSQRGEISSTVVRVSCLLPDLCPCLLINYFLSSLSFFFFFNYRVLQNALLLSDSSLHLFLQSHLNSEDIEACVSGQTKYSVEEAIHKFALMNRRFPEEDEEGKKDNDVDYDSERYSFALGSSRHIYLTHSVHVHAHR